MVAPFYNVYSDVNISIMCTEKVFLPVSLPVIKLFLMSVKVAHFVTKINKIAMKYKVFWYEIGVK